VRVRTAKAFQIRCCSAACGAEGAVAPRLAATIQRSKVAAERWPAARTAAAAVRGREMQRGFPAHSSGLHLGALALARFQARRAPVGGGYVQAVGHRRSLQAHRSTGQAQRRCNVSAEGPCMTADAHHARRLAVRLRLQVS
jgi:hypothetical protein